MTLRFSQVPLSTAGIANLEALSVANIDSPTELNSIAGTVVGERRVCYQAIAGDNVYTIYCWDSADSSGASSPHVVAGSSGFWIAVAGKYVNSAVKIRGTLTIADTTSSTSTSTGALVVSGGVGVGGACFAQQFNAGGGSASALAAYTVSGFSGITGTTAIGLFVNATAPSTATAAVRGAQFSLTTAASTAVTEATGFVCAAITAGASGSIANATGARIHPQSGGTNNCGLLITTGSPTYTGNFAIRSETSYPSTFAGGITSSHATAGIGYSTGAGGTVTQATSRSTGVTLNTCSGAITLVSAAGSTTPTTFTVTNSVVAATDVILLNQKSGTDKYLLFVTNVSAGSFQITAYTTGGTTTEQPVISFDVIKGVTA